MFPRLEEQREGGSREKKSHNSTERNVWEISGCQWRLTFKYVHMCACVCVHVSVCSDHGLEQTIL